VKFLHHFLDFISILFFENPTFLSNPRSKTFLQLGRLKQTTP